MSRILWHFTGGPIWDPVKRRQQQKPKPAKNAYNNLKSILRTQELRLGSYQETIRVRIPERKQVNLSTRNYTTEKDVVEELASTPVCCLADIPIMHLSYLAARYGKFAIGFHRDAVVAHGFNPVFYALDDSSVIRSIYQGLSMLRYVDTTIVEWAIDDMRTTINDFLNEHELNDTIDDSALDAMENEASDIEDSVSASQDMIERFLGFVKTFAPDEFGTIYCEREWRSLSTFRFDVNSVAMIVLPRNVGKTKYFERFVKNTTKTLKLPRSVPVVPWEDLVEH